MLQKPLPIVPAFILAALSGLLPLAGYAQPATQPTTQSTERISVPDPDLARIREAAIFAETANAAGLDWKPYYLAFMKLERRKDWTDKQIKFIGMYFGALQGRYGEELRSKKYSEDEVLALRDRLEHETARLNKEATTRPYRERSE